MARAPRRRSASRASYSGERAGSNRGHDCSSEERAYSYNRDEDRDHSPVRRPRRRRRRQAAPRADRGQRAGDAIRRCREEPSRRRRRDGHREQRSRHPQDCDSRERSEGNSVEEARTRKRRRLRRLRHRDASPDVDEEPLRAPRRRRRRRVASPAGDGVAGDGDEQRSAEPRRKRRRTMIVRPDHFQWESGIKLGPDRRYTVERLLGDGVFGRVLLCRDSESKTDVAVKVAGAAKRPQRQAEREAEALRQLEDFDEERYLKYCPRLVDTFVHDDQGLCLVYQPLDCSLQELLRNGGGQGLFMADIKRIAYQLLSGLAFIHEAGLAHTDIKCTNVMLRDGSFDTVQHPRLPCPALAPRTCRPCEAVLIDFGGAAVPPLLDGQPTEENGQSRPGVRVGARQIRAPEVILGLDWDLVADCWSMGCLLVSLYTGERLFKVHDDMEHLAMIERLMEQRVPVAMLQSACPRLVEKGLAIDKKGRLDWPEHARSDDSVAKVEELDPLSVQILARHKPFLELVRGLLAVAPGSRMKARAALESKFCTADDIPE